MKKILVAECKQEISSFNPVVTHYEDFVIHRGDALFASRRDTEAEIAGALDVFVERDDVELIPAWGANACSSGPLEQAGFARLAEEFVAAITPYKGKIDAFYFVLHGAMGATEELDPEGYLLQEARRVLGA